MMKNKPRTKRSKETKQRNYDPTKDEPLILMLVKEHIPYELDMLNGTYDALARGEKDPIIRNALIESFCIHCRNLIKFLKNRDYNLKVLEISPSFDHKKVAIKKDYIDLISHQIAHLSKRRVSEDDKKIGPDLWKEMYIEISSQIPKFVANLSPRYQACWPGWVPLKNVALINGGANTVIRVATSSNGPIGPSPTNGIVKYSTLPTGPLRSKQDL